MGRRSQDLLEQTEVATEARWHQVKKKKKKSPLKALADNNMQQNFKKSNFIKKKKIDE